MQLKFCRNTIETDVQNMTNCHACFWCSISKRDQETKINSPEKLTEGCLNLSLKLLLWQDLLVSSFMPCTNNNISHEHERVGIKFMKNCLPFLSGNSQRSAMKCILHSLYCVLSSVETLKLQIHRQLIESAFKHGLTGKCVSSHAHYLELNLFT